MTTKYDFIKDERSFFKFCRYLLSIAVSYHTDHFSTHQTYCHTNWTMYMFDNTTLSTMFNSTRSLMLREIETYSDQAPKNMVFRLEAFANRFQCTDEEELSKSVKRTGLIDEIDLYPTLIVYRILKGYNLLQQGEICPGYFLYDIFKKYGSGCMSARGLNRLIGDLVHGPPGFQQMLYHNNNNQHFDDGRPINKRSSDRRSYLSPNSPPSVGEDNRWQGPGPMLPQYLSDSGGHDSQCHSWSHSNFLHQSSRTIIDRHSWEPTDKYLNVSDMLSMFYGSRKSSTLSYSSFLDICPTILHQHIYQTKVLHSPPILPPPDYHPSHVTTHIPSSSVTVTIPTVTTSRGNETTDTQKQEKEQIARYQSYLYGSLSVLVISLCSLLGAGFMKLSGADVKIHIMGTMLALGVGCLVSDAALHLLPEVILDEDGSNYSDEGIFPEHIKKLCAFLASVYAFFVLELFLSQRQHHSHKHYTSDEHDLVNPDIKIVSLQKDNIEIKETNLNNKIQKTNSDDSQKSANYNLPKTNNRDNDSDITVVRNTSSSTHRSNDDRISVVSDTLSTHNASSGIKALAWMIIIGDGLHNFADGLAIGAAFTMTFTKGLSTSITVLCHEIPHELGDFAVLISTGLSIKKAMVLNFLSSLTAFAGLYVGILLGAQDDASKWIFSVGAGLFLYVALTDLVPECKDYFKRRPTRLMFIGQNMGLITGYVIMLLLALYEEKLEINI
ncbi:hypothetical protein ACF0H5_022651 [Mactra antiquata]